MDVFLRITLYLVMFILLLWANVSFVRTVYNELRPAGGADVIAPFEIVGKDEQKLGLVLARMLQAQLGKIGREMEASAIALKAAERSSRPRTQDLSAPQRVDVPTQVFDPVAINIKVGSVEVGGVIEWVQKRLIRDRSLQLAVQYDGDKAITVGDLDLGGDVRSGSRAGAPTRRSSRASHTSSCSTSSQRAFLRCARSNPRSTGHSFRRSRNWRC